MVAAVAQDVERRPAPDGTLETRQERERRLFKDPLPIDMRRGGRLIGRAPARLRELRMVRLAAERVLADRNATDAERREAKETLLDAIPDIKRYEEDTYDPTTGKVIKAGEPIKIGNAVIYDPKTFWTWARRSGRVDEWFEPKKLAPPGRPKGKTPKRREPTLIERLAELEGVDAEADRVLLPQVWEAYRKVRGAGVRPTPARLTVAAKLSEEYDVEPEVVEKILIEEILEQRGRGPQKRTSE